MEPVDTSSIVALEAALSVSLDLNRARDVLRAPDQGWLGDEADDGSVEPARRRFRTDLRLLVRPAGHEITFHKAALVGIGPVREVPGALRMDVCWRSANLAPLFPVFAGQLTVQSDMLTLNGLYAPPGGRIGLALDRVMLGFAARGTARWFLGLVAGALASDAIGQHQLPTVVAVSRLGAIP
jgi:hypothetical protein